MFIFQIYVSSSLTNNKYSLTNIKLFYPYEKKKNVEKAFCLPTSIYGDADDECSLNKRPIFT